MASPYVAEIRIFAGNFAPRGWAFCEGQLLQIAQNTALFSLLGTTYGGDGRTTFGLPDLKARGAMHEGNGPGLTSRRLGEKGGQATATLNATQMAGHSHTLVGSSGETDEEGTSNPAGATTGVVTASTSMYGPTTSLGAMSPSAIDSVGGGQVHNNVQPYIALNFIIALQGVFPSPN
ncbi:MAG: tail fiber protein [Acidimicrobiia bacterium]|nr:tail fiber protein [Acidimicrobiia bacterium]